MIIRKLKVKNKEGKFVDCKIGTTTPQVIIGMTQPISMNTGDVWFVVEGSNEDKAVEMARNTYEAEHGYDSSVKFGIERTFEDGHYYVSVRDKESNYMSMWYEVQVDAGTCEEAPMLG